MRCVVMVLRLCYNLIDKSEVESLIIGCDWNCTLTKKGVPAMDKKVGLHGNPPGVSKLHTYRNGSV